MMWMSSNTRRWNNGKAEKLLSVQLNADMRARNGWENAPTAGVGIRLQSSLSKSPAAHKSAAGLSMGNASPARPVQLRDIRRKPVGAPKGHGNRGAGSGAGRRHCGGQRCAGGRRAGHWKIHAVFADGAMLAAARAACSIFRERNPQNRWPCAQSAWACIPRCAFSRRQTSPSFWRLWQRRSRIF